MVSLCYGLINKPNPNHTTPGTNVVRNSSSAIIAEHSTDDWTPSKNRQKFGV